MTQPHFADPQPALAPPGPMLQAMIRKRNGRMSRWVLRFVTLAGSRISYTLNAESPSVRATFNLSAGCILSDIIEDKMLSGKRLFTFWVLWPAETTHSQEGEQREEKTTRSCNQSHHDSGHTQEEKDNADDNSDDEESYVKPSGEGGKGRERDLKQVLEQEKTAQRHVRQAAAQIIERHTTHDSNVSTSLKLAAVGLGGLLVGVLTAGIGLVPYVAAVGLTAIAGGSAVAIKYRAPSDSRLILGFETMMEATLWRSRIEAAVVLLEKDVKPLISKHVNTRAVSFLLAASRHLAGWRRSGIWDGVRIAKCDIASRIYRESMSIIDDAICDSVLTRGQRVLARNPDNIFLHLMEHCPWNISAANNNNITYCGQVKRPGAVEVSGSRCEVLKTIDAHTEMVSIKVDLSLRRTVDSARAFLSNSLEHGTFWKLLVSLLAPIFTLALSLLLSSPLANLLPRRAASRTLKLVRYWHRDDDGSYIISFNSCDDEPLSQPSFAATITISPPRRGAHHDNSEDEDTRRGRTLVAATVRLQAGQPTYNNNLVHIWQQGEADEIAQTFLLSTLGGLREGSCGTIYSAVSTVTADAIVRPPKVVLQTTGPTSIEYASVTRVISPRNVPSTPRTGERIGRVPGFVVDHATPGYLVKNTLATDASSIHTPSQTKRRLPQPRGPDELSLSPTSDSCATPKAPTPLKLCRNRSKVQQLRDQLALKQYELQRLTSQARGADILSEQCRDAAVVFLREELSALMRDYELLAGVPYDETKSTRAHLSSRVCEESGELRDKTADEVTATSIHCNTYRNRTLCKPKNMNSRPKLPSHWGPKKLIRDSWILAQIPSPRLFQGIFVFVMLNQKAVMLFALWAGLVLVWRLYEMEQNCHL